MSEKPENPPAFPCAEDHRVAADIDWTAGMSLRDWFAGQTIGALVPYWSGCTVEELAHGAYRLADAMLAERARSA